MSGLASTKSEDQLQKHASSSIVEHTTIAPGVRLIVLQSPEIAVSCHPGQFVHVKCAADGSLDPLLRRPLSIHDAEVDTGHVSLLYEIRGRGTKSLSHKSAGELLDIIGPIGRSFPMPSPSDKEVLFVAGGIGVAPLYFLAKRIVNDFSNLNMKLFIGARTECLLTCVEKFHDLGCEVETATDDGSAGFHGLVTELFEKHLSGISRNHPPIVYASGPMPMLSAVAELAKKHSFNCWVSTEAKMACGIGACMGCAIKVKAAGSWKYVRCCREGPVFSSAEVVWE